MGKLDKKTSFIILATFAFVFIFFLSQVFSNDFRIKVLNVFRIPFKIISGSYYVLRDVANFKAIKDENRFLRENIENLEKKLLDLHEAYLENERLKNLLEFRDVRKRKVVPAMVIARDPLRVKDTLIIDKGKKDSLQKDMAVISGNGLVGRVTECGWSISRVLLITDCDSVVSSIVQRTRDEGAVVGNMDAGLIMKYLELGADVTKGDEVITSGFGSIFEKGILIGKVVSVEKDSQGLYLNAIVKPEVDIRRLEEVLVVR